jgi:hypothetical protein
MSVQPLIPLSEELPTPVVTRDAGDIEGVQLLALHTESGVVYVCPTRWQRLRLRWAFRHFPVLPPQVLSRSDQRLIEELSRTAVVTPVLPVANENLIGVVEKARTKPTELGPQLVPMKNKVIVDEPTSASTSAAASIQESLAKGGDFGRWETRQVRIRQWGPLGALAASSIVVIVAATYGGTLLPKAAEEKKPAAVTKPVEQAAIRVSPLPVPLAVVEKPKLPVPQTAPPAPKPVVRQSAPLPSAPEPPVVESRPVAAPVEPVASVPSGGSERWFSELPQGHFSEPVVSNPKLVGEVRLKALIGADGSVRDVTVVSGDPKLAEAGMRAVRNWHYSQYQALGRQDEAETLIRMNFFGEDAVSITSVAR